MRDRMEKFVVLPFSVGCVSQSSVAVSDNQPKKAPMESTPSPKKGGEVTGLSSGKMKNSFRLLPLPKPDISAGIHRIIKSIKNFSQLFAVYKEELDGDMEIGLPTDVQHVTHIGLDGSNNITNMKNWDKAPEFLSLPSLSLRQFELAMASQADGPLPNDPLRFA